MPETRTIRKTFTVSFNTPAFLGDAGQSGEWRTPPFKALLREWWRVVKANELLRWGVEPQRLHAEVREAEGRLFGHAWLTYPDQQRRDIHWAARSRVSLHLKSWDLGALTQNQWPRGEFATVKGRVTADVYLGMGPVGFNGRLSKPPAIKLGAENSNTLKIIQQALTSDEQAELDDALHLTGWFGALGSRHRNGWGSLDIGIDQNLPDEEQLKRVCRSWETCLDLDWAHAIGTDASGPLIWHSEPLTDWRKAMGRLANIKIVARQSAKRFRGPGKLGGIHLLGYPAGDHWTMEREFGSEGRLASQLRFKVCREGEQVRGLIFHLPCRFPKKLRDGLSSSQKRWLEDNEHSVWADIHEVLDQDPRLQRLGGGNL